MKLEVKAIAGAIRYAFCSGVKGIFTAHGDSFEEICSNLELESLLKTNMIERIIFLDKNIKGKINKVYELDKKNREYKLTEANEKIKLEVIS